MRLTVAPIVLLAGVVLAGEPPRGKPVAPICISGIYPHLAVFNGRYDPKRDTWTGTGGECGIGAIVPWAGKLWVMTYPQHDTRGGPDKLWTIDKDLEQAMRPESVGGTHAGRMIHRESNQLIIGPYFVDAKGTVRAADVKSKLVGRITAIARHLTDPANRVYVFDMEGAIYEVDVHTLGVTRLFVKPVPGWHGKGGYTGQGRFIIANNGERGYRKVVEHLQVGGPPKGRDECGCLAEWDGATWRIVDRRQFLDVTGPGGLHGNPDDAAPVWTIGWDRRSCLLKLLDGGQWTTFRLPKASHTFDPRHGWYTEWPRIREAGGGRWMICLHGMFFDLPPTFRAGRTGGIRAIASHLRYIPDFCDWDGRLVLAADDASTFGNPFCSRAQSNLWIGTLDGLKRFGPRAGWGGPWVSDAVKAAEVSDPILVGGFEKRCLHLSTKAGRRAAAGGAMRTSDRFAIDGLPAELAGLPRVTIARGDYHEPAPGFAFTVDRPVTVYLAMDERGKPDPGEGWRKTPLRLTWGGNYRDVVFAKHFARGRVEIPGRTDTHGGTGHYAVPSLAFLEAAGKLAVTGLPKELGGKAVVPTAAPAPAPKAAAASFTVEIDPDGSGAWAPYKTLAVPASGYACHLLPSDLKAEWLRVRADRDGTATAYLHCASPRAAEGDDEAIFAGLAKASARAGMCAGLVRPAGHNTRLQFLDRDGGYWEVDETMAFHRVEPGRADEVREICAMKQEFAVDDASVIMTWKGRRYRLPKGAAAYDEPFAIGWPRCVREVQSERYLVNVHGTFYEMPRDTGVPELKPVATHNRAIMDFCSWRGLLVLSGTRVGARSDGNTFTSADGEVSLWFGAVDDLWRLGKPVGRGGPWKSTAVEAGQSSAPYLMTNYDRKALELSHDADAQVAFTVEVDFDHTGTWHTYAVLEVAPGKTLRHVFPDGYGAHWLRLTADRACTATAWLLYE